MITYDYKIERKISENKTQTFVPSQISTQLPNLVYIEGPNSSGKSTLLNIIALGLLGIKSRKMNPILLKRMASLLDSDYQEVTFRVEISSDTEGLIIRSRKDDPNKSEIILEESTDGESYKPISFEKFESKYNLIYDIPNNPTERLYDLIKELKEEQVRYGNRFKEFGWFLRSTIKEITRYRDPKRLDELKEKLEEAGQKREQLIEKLPGLQGFLDSLEKNVYVKFYYFYLNECERLKEAKSRIEEKSRKLTKTGRKLTTKGKKLRKEILELQRDFSSYYREVTPLIESMLPKNERHRFEIWKSINPYDPGDSDLDRIKKEAIHFVNLFGPEIDNMRSEESFEDATVLVRIIQALKEFENSSFMIPKMKVTIGEFIRMLREESRKSYILISNYENLNKIVNLLSSLRETVDPLKDKLKEEGEILAASTEVEERYSKSYWDEQVQLRNLTDELKKAKKTRDDYFRKCLSKNIERKMLEERSFKEIIEELPKSEELKPFLSLSEKQIEKKISELEEEIAAQRKEKDSLEVFIEQYRKEKERLEKQKPHKYEQHQTQLVNLLKKIESVSQKLLHEYKSNIRDLVERKVEKTEIEKHVRKRRYYEEVSKYLASRIGFFKHIDTTYKAKTVDLITGVIVTSDDLTIHLADMGTGQSQSAYLLGLLNVEDDNRRIIALFDEIAMMDDSSLKPIYDKLQSLYKAKRLLLGILVQKANEINIRSLEEGLS